MDDTILTLNFIPAIKLVRARAEGMQYAAEMVDSGMATVMYGPDSTLGHACKRAVDYCVTQGIESPVCMVANYLFPHCKVVAGHTKVISTLKIFDFLHLTKTLSHRPWNF